jgi:hypothetical protein
MSQQKKNVEIRKGQTWKVTDSNETFTVNLVQRDNIHGEHSKLGMLKLSELFFSQHFTLVNESKPDQETYDNTNGSLYKVADERNWNSYVFDAMKRLDRAERKGQFISDIDKTIKVLEMYKEEQGHRFKHEL